MKEDLQKAEKAAKVAKYHNATMITEMEAVKNSIVSLNEQYKIEKATLESELETCKLEAGDQYENGFNATLAQVRIIAPEVDISRLMYGKNS